MLNICLTKKFGFSGLDINTAGAFVDSTNVDAVAPLAAQEIRGGEGGGRGAGAEALEAAG